jgi:hypothetical protein
MSERGDDLRNYLPDLNAIAREADPALAEEKHRSALANPELDRVVADLKQGLREGEAPFEFPLVPGRPKAEGAPAAVSPWAGDAPPVERGALPSSLAPAAATLVSAVSGQGAGARARGARGLRPWAVRALAALAVLGPVTMMAIFSQALPERAGVPAPSPSDWGQTTARASAPPGAGAEGARSADPLAAGDAPQPGGAGDPDGGSPAATPARTAPAGPWTSGAPRALPRPAGAARPIAKDIMH